MRKALLALAASALFCAPAFADSRPQSVRNGSEAIGDAASASTRIVASGGQVALGASAAPVIALGAGAQSVGDGARAVGYSSWQAANTPLPVAQAVIVAQPAPVVPFAPTTQKGR
jgi:hypothetical protein